MIIILLLFILMLSLFVLNTKDLLHGIIALSAVSLLIALLFYLCNAPDVAITEAAVGAGVSTIVFIGAIRYTERRDK
ncbi:MAG: DUF4040 domain-containing protein [Sphaerochaetaceae bacterium]|nr:DUF4040 domain-containing protein [Sphaerochaetaceae bacterium]MDD2406836.1 DUF4040 domain-containing protein [Sphaerochaetaceae bacterium]MDD3671518.1 DUF4040 domain-containing protein [Sphaerochaetaceae bacterium]MDD4763117.1 DUF4040 domain-containing protein [Sphaerochaetaceae bacterium]MDD4841284.1 DUF4040 domain-containing protein [Sphaerochaetaceae bacterium]